MMWYCNRNDIIWGYVRMVVYNEKVYCWETRLTLTGICIYISLCLEPLKFQVRLTLNRGDEKRCRCEEVQMRRGMDEKSCALRRVWFYPIVQSQRMKENEMGLFNGIRGIMQTHAMCWLSQQMLDNCADCISRRWNWLGGQYQWSFVLERRRLQGERWLSQEEMNELLLEGDARRRWKREEERRGGGVDGWMSGWVDEREDFFGGKRRTED